MNIIPVSQNNGLIASVSLTLDDDILLSSIAVYKKLDGRITPEKYDKLVEKGEKRMLEIDEELVAFEKSYEGSELTVSNLFKLACNADDLLKSSKPAIKNQILRLLLSNCEIQQKRLQFNLLEPFTFIKKLDSRPKWLPGLDSNQQPRS